MSNNDNIDKVAGVPVIKGNTFDGVDDTVEYKASAYLEGAKVAGHRLDFSNDGYIRCYSCDMEREVPDLLQETSGFRQVLYRIYLVKEFEHESCDGAATFSGTMDSVTIRTDTGSVEIPNGNITTSSTKSIKDIVKKQQDNWNRKHRSKSMK